MAIDPTTTITVKVSELASAAFNSSDLVPHEVGGFLKKGTLYDLAQYVKSIIDAEGAIGFRAVQVTDGETLPATDEQEFILVGPGTFPNVGGGATITTTGSLNALVSNGTFWFIGVEIPIEVNGTWGEIDGVISDQDDLWEILEAKADLVDGKVPASQLPSYVDDIVEVANFAALPATGETGKIYLTLDNNKIYRWSGSVYIEIAENQAVWGSITGTLSNQTDLQSALNLRVPTSRTLTINGTAFDLSANRSWTIPTHDAVTLGTPNGLSLSGQVLSLGLSSGSANGALSSTDWTTFNNKQPLIAHLEFNDTDKTVWNNGKSNIFSNTSFGQSALNNNTTGNSNAAYGTTSMSANTTGENNSAFGLLSLRFNTTGNHNIAIGSSAGSYIADSITTNAICNTSIFLGSQSKALANNQTNQIVIGYDAIGHGTNTVTLGNTNIVTTILRGNVGIGTTSPSARLSVLNAVTTTATVMSVGTSNNGLNFIINSNGSPEIASAAAVAPIHFSQGSTRVMTLSDNGNVGIGTTSPQARLHISNPANSGFLYSDGAGTGFSFADIRNTGARLVFGIENSTGSTSFTGALPYSSYIGSFASGTAFSIVAGNSLSTTFLPNGNVGIGTTSPGSSLDIGNGTGLRQIYINGGGYDLILGASGGSAFGFASTNASMVFNTSAKPLVIGTLSTQPLVFGTNDVERMRITSGGDVLVGISSTFTNARYQSENITGSKAAMALRAQATTASTILEFWNPNGQVGDIRTSGSATSYITSSDYRLKQDLKPINGLDLVSQIKVYDYEWKSDETRAYGVLAHELQEVIPQAVSGEKDDEKMQGVDYSKLVPILVQAIQELKAEIEILKTK